ncbi:Mu transposase domain-containing protein [Allobaculum sp. JKK-2023]|uniref:Mu transposase domain-containing protein n=1 Tax=Allobaculum sp. JKK-2023 TaxID=3108943 RepID=UPI002B052951|nr:Mu transposase C-terminal domain-containing protein [Allobaculum sp. JKK-2023]
MNANSKIEEEKEVLKPIPEVPYEAAVITTAKVNKYSFIRVDNNSYSVPKELVGKTVKVKKDPEHILALYDKEIVADHPRLNGKNKTCLDIRHYLGTLNKKPGALRNSTVLKQEPVLEEFFKKYFTEKPKEFIEFIRKNKDVPFEEKQ